MLRKGERFLRPDERITSMEALFGQVLELGDTALVRLFAEGGKQTVELRLDDPSVEFPRSLRREGQGICFVEARVTSANTKTERLFGRFEFGGGPVRYTRAQERLIDALAGA